MIWLNLKALENRLARGEVSEKTGAKYLFSLIIFIAAASFLPEMSGYYSTYWWDLLEAVLAIAISGWGISSAFKVNRSGGREFLKRFLALAFVNGVRLIIAAAVLYLLYKIIMFVIPLSYFYFFDDLLENEYSQLFFTLLLYFLFYLLVIRSFKRINFLQEEKLRDQAYKR